MDEGMQTQEIGKSPKKRKAGQRKSSKTEKKLKMLQGTGEKVKIDRKMKKLFRKRARDYNSDDDESAPAIGDVGEQLHDSKKVIDGNSSDEEGENHGLHGDAGEEKEVSEDEDEDSAIQPGITKFTEVSLQGPVLSAHKKLVVEKLAEEEVERKVKGEAKKEKHLVNKAQNAQKGLNPSRSRDAKAIRKKRKETFFSELGKRSSQFTDMYVRIPASTGPTWAPLHDNFMLTNSKLKDWDKMPDTIVADDFGMPSDSSSDDD